jgi:hypothetical protein
MIFEKFNIMDELQVLEESQKMLDDRLEQKMIEPETYIKKSQEISEKINKLRKKKFDEENYQN